MPTTDQNKPTGKSGQRNRKAEQRNEKSDRQISRTPKQQHEPEQKFAATAEPADVAAFSAAAEAADVSPISAAAEPTALATIDQPAGSVQDLVADAASKSAAAAYDAAPVSVQTIANAYGDYTRKSFEQTRSFFDRLTRVRSLDKAVEVQVEFAKQAYETFVSEMQKICGLHTELARQSLRPLEGLMAKSTREAYQSLNGAGTRH
jgi:hypothetical protein